jgi:effector-binding domain-containing protein
MLDTPVILATDQIRTAVIPLLVPRAEIVSYMDGAMRELSYTLAAQGIPPAGPCFSLHRRRPAETFDFEVGFPVARPVIPTGRVLMSELPAARVARAVYQGGYEGLAAAWSELFDWIEAAGLHPQARLWECYCRGPESGADPTRWRTELISPLEPG